MARKRRTYGLGSTGKVHRTTAKLYAADLAATIQTAKREIAGGSCTLALNSLVRAGRLMGGMQAHRRASSDSKKTMHRTAATSQATSYALGKLQAAYLKACVR